MKYQLFHYRTDGDVVRTGMAVATHSYDLATVAGNDAIVAWSIDAMLDDWSAACAKLEALAAEVSMNPSRAAAAALDREKISFAPPLVRPGVIYAAGANYRDHVAAMSKAFNMKLSLDPKSEGIAPWHFIKAGRGTLAAHRERVAMPGHTKTLDWEAELAIVMGRRARNVSIDNALDYVAGYTCANDLSARDNLRRDNVDASSPFRFDWIGHKCFTGACPLGPMLTPAQFVASPENLDIKLWLNDQLRQDSNTSNHLYGVAEQIAYLSGRLELFPGDVILSGTPAGVGMESQTFLRPGDVMRVWIEGLGELETTIAP